MYCPNNVSAVGRVDNTMLGKAKKAEPHDLLLTMVTPDKKAGELTVTIKSETKLKEIPKFVFSVEGGCSKEVSIRSTDEGFTFLGILHSIPRFLQCTIEVRGVTQEGRPTSAIEQFVVARISSKEEVRVVGPRGHVVMFVSSEVGVSETSICVGPPELQRIIAPEGKVLFSPCYRLAATNGDDFPYPILTEFRLPTDERARIDPRFDPQTLGIYKWNRVTSEWEIIPSVLFGRPWAMLQAKVLQTGTYAVFGQMRIEHQITIKAPNVGPLAAKDDIRSPVAVTKEVDNPQIFTLVNLGKGRVAVRARNGRYLAVNSETGILTPSSSVVDISETFELLIQPEGTAVLRTVDGLYLSIEGDGRVIAANKKSGLGSMFRIMFVEDTPSGGLPPRKRPGKHELI